MTDQLVAFLRERYAEEKSEAEEALKRTTTTRRWMGGQWVEGTVQPPAWRRSAWSPQKVLAEVEAKRGIVDELEPAPREPRTDEELHSRFAHPAYEYRTTTGPRKQWGDADTPPVDESSNPDPTWERNTDAGSDGWMRFDFTEESYWRRLRADGPDPAPAAPRILRLLAIPYADHPDYQDEWRP